MFLNSKVIYFICAAFVSSTNVTAKEVYIGKQISFVEAIQKSLKYNLELERYQYQSNSKQYQIKHSALSPSPEIGLKIEDAYGSGAFKDMDNAQLSINISWVIEGDLREAFVEYEKVGLLSIDNELISKKLEISAATAKYYITSLAYQAQLKNSEEALRLAENITREVRKRLRAGKTTKAELIHAQAQLAHRELETDDIKHELNSAYYQLASQWGEKKPNFARVKGDVYHIPKMMKLESIYSSLDKSPVIRELLIYKKQKNAELKVEKEKSNSTWRVNVGVKESKLTNDQSLIAGISIPFGEKSRNKFKIAQSKEELLEIESNNKALVQGLKTKLFVLYEEFKHHLHQIDAHKNKIIPLLEKAVVESERAYQLGRYSYLDWSSVQKDLLTAKKKLLLASKNAQLKFIEIQYLSGSSIKAKNKKQGERNE